MTGVAKTVKIALDWHDLPLRLGLGHGETHRPKGGQEQHTLKPRWIHHFNFRLTLSLQMRKIAARGGKRQTVYVLPFSL
jgi:hypothetical protein